ncbi:MAG: PilZ domain-containing protein [Deltaproteobacteria bacterium]|nr:PilZ domain-containing protein [Deltaproteobacteria bacterium]
MATGSELRQHPRFRLQLPVEVALPTGAQLTSTTGISREGVSLRLDPVPAIDTVARLAIALPDGRRVLGTGRCRTLMAGGHCGLHLHLDGDARAVWQAFVAEEESSGSLWRMIGRIAASPDDPFAMRGEVDRVDGDAALRFHTVGENGLAYRLAFEKHAADPPEASDLATLQPGFLEPARRAVSRVLREDVTLRFEEGAQRLTVRARVVELLRGGYAYVMGDRQTPIGFVALAVGELLLVERGGVAVFPCLTAAELEQVAADAFCHDGSRPRAVSPGRSAGAERSDDAKRFIRGFDAVRFAQAATEGAQRRRYGDRDMYFHPAVWACVRLDDGVELQGPTLQDGARLCVLGLVGPGAPRVVKLTPASDVVLLPPPGR